MAKSKSTNLLQQQSDLNSRFGMQPVNFGDISLLQIIAKSLQDLSSKNTSQPPSKKNMQNWLEKAMDLKDDPDAYEAENIFFVPPEARWSEIAKAAYTPEIGTILDKAMIAIEADNKSLKGVLPKNYANPELDKRVLGNVVDVFTNMDMSDT